MNKIIELVNGKKTYIVAALIGITAAASALGYVVPEWIWLTLNAVGLGAVRDALPKKG